MRSLARHRRIVRRPNPPIDLKELVDLDAEQIKVLNRYAKRGREHTAIMRRIRPILERNGYRLGADIGSGSAATAYSLADFPEYVAKLTYDPTDAAIMSELSTLPNPPPAGLPEVITVAYLGDGLYLIVMERLEPLAATQQRSIDALARKLAFGHEVMAHPNLWKAWKDKPAAPQHAYLNALRFVHALGYNAYDIGEDNVMRRPSDKSAVVSDFGFSSPRRGEAVRQDVPRLRNPRTSLQRRLPAHMRTTRKNPVIDLSDFDASRGRSAVTSNNRREMALAAPNDADALKVLARNGFSLGKVLGTGTAASVYEVVDDPRWVMKITADATDAAVMAELQFAPRDAQGRLPPGIPEVAGVYDLGNGLYGILVEYLLPLSRSEAADVADMMFTSQFGWYYEIVEARYNALSPSNPLRAVLNAILVVYALGFRMSDISDNNVMKRENGDFVVSDFGYAGVDLDKRRHSRDIPTLRNPRRAAPRKKNPRDRLPPHMRTTRKNPVIDLSKFPVLEDALDSQFPVWQRKADAPMVRDAYAREVLARNGIQTTPESIGEGSFAAVYPMRDDPNVVVKITNDPTDAAIMAEMAFVPIQPGVPKVYGVYDLGEAPDARAGGNIYAILVERLLPLTEEQKHVIKYLSADVERGWSSEEVDEVWSDFKDAPASVGYAYLNAVRILRALGFRPSDLHASNLMRRRDGSFAVSDFGLSLWDRFGSPVSRDIRRLQNPRRRR